MNLPCKHTVLQLEICHICNLFWTRDDYNLFWGGDGIAKHAVSLEGEVIKCFDHTNLFPQIPGKRFNASICSYGNEYLFAFRNGWAGSDIFLVRLDNAFQPKTYKKLDLRRDGAMYGREDPRLFWHNDNLYLAYIGVDRNGGLHTNQMYARLDTDFNVVANFFPRYAKRSAWEKNWAFFSSEGKLYAVYKSSPKHQIIQLDGEVVTEVADTKNRMNYVWRFGEIRGGAPPVLVGDEYWSFFHSRHVVKGHRVYSTGLYTFETMPPFKARRMLTVPVAVADRATNKDNYASVVFPCGAVLDRDKWLIAMGVHDRWAEIRSYAIPRDMMMGVCCGN